MPGSGFPAVRAGQTAGAAGAANRPPRHAAKRSCRQAVAAASGEIPLKSRPLGRAHRDFRKRQSTTGRGGHRTDRRVWTDGGALVLFCLGNGFSWTKDLPVHRSATRPRDAPAARKRLARRLGPRARTGRGNWRRRSVAVRERCHGDAAGRVAALPVRHPSSAPTEGAPSAVADPHEIDAGRLPPHGPQATAPCTVMTGAARAGAGWRAGLTPSDGLAAPPTCPPADRPLQV